MASLKCLRCGGEYGLMVNEPQQWFTPAEASDYLRVPFQAIQRMVREERLPSYQVPGATQLRFRRQDLDAALHPSEQSARDALLAWSDGVLADIWDNELDDEYDEL